MTGSGGGVTDGVSGAVPCGVKAVTGAVESVMGGVAGTTGGVETVCTTGAGTAVATSSGTEICSPGRRTFDPQRLQNADPTGTRLPHRKQNDPSGSDEVSMGLVGTGPVSTIFFIGRAISIFFFTAELLVIRICGGVVTSGSFS